MSTLLSIQDTLNKATGPLILYYTLNEHMPYAATLLRKGDVVVSAILGGWENK